MTVLVTGAAGQVGREIVMRADKLHVVGLDRDALNIADAERVRRAIDQHRAKIIINAAAYTAVDKAEADPQGAYRVNRDGPSVLATACKNASIPLIHLSTDYVFDGTGKGAYSAESPAAPLGIYGESKWAGEEAVRATLAQHLILRVSWVFGAYGNNFVKTMLRLSRERSELRVVADQRGAPTHAGAIADTLLAVSKRHLDGEPLAWGTWHYTGTPIVSWREFASSIFEEATALGMLEYIPNVVGISTSEYPTPARRPANSELDTSATTTHLGIAPRPWIEGLREVLTEWKKIK